MAIISTFSLIVFIVTLIPEFNSPEYRRLRGSLFLILGISTSIPILHLALFGKYVIGFESIKPESTNYRFIGQALDEYIMIELKDEMYIIDKKLACEKLIYEKKVILYIISLFYIHFPIPKLFH